MFELGQIKGIHREEDCVETLTYSVFVDENGNLAAIKRKITNKDVGSKPIYTKLVLEGSAYKMETEILIDNFDNEIVRQILFNRFQDVEGDTIIYDIQEQ